MGDGIKPEVGQIWRMRTRSNRCVLRADNDNIHAAIQRANAETSSRASVFNADGTFSSDHSCDLVEFIGYAPGYGPSAIEHKAVSVGKTETFVSAPTDAELHARDGLTATDRRLLNERMDRQRHEQCERERREEAAKNLRDAENAITMLFDGEMYEADYRALTGCRPPKGIAYNE